MIIRYILTAIAGYLLGSISTGLIWAKLHHGPNLREVGSKNTGASNVQRTMGTGHGLVVFCGDVIKALLACLIGRLLCGQYGCMLGGLMAVIGHNWPVFFQFKGGKGVASSCGVMLMCFWEPALIGYLAAIALIAALRYISLGSMTMALIYALLVILWKAGGDILTILWAVAMAALCIGRHHANIGRLLAGNERKLSGFFKKKESK